MRGGLDRPERTARLVSAHRSRVRLAELANKVEVCLDLLEGDDLSGLDLILHGLDLLLKVIDGNIVCDNGAHLELHQAKAHLSALALAPKETVHLDGADLLLKSVKVDLGVSWLDGQNKGGLADSSLLLLASSSSGLSLGGGSLFFLSNFTSEWIDLLGHYKK